MANSTVRDYIRVDSAAYPIAGTNKYLIFIVFDNKVKNISNTINTTNSILYNNKIIKKPLQ
jgi:hypothetical protein